MELEAITERILAAAYRVHSVLGPGMLESAYEACLEHELRSSGLRVERQVNVPVRYGDLEIPVAYRIDLLVDGCVVVEIKAVQELADVHRAQLLTYLRFASLRVGLLLNFNVKLLKVGGIVRVINA